MSYESWGDGDDMGPPDGYCTTERAEELFVGGLQASSSRRRTPRWRSRSAPTGNRSGARTPAGPEKVYVDPWEA